MFELDNMEENKFELDAIDNKSGLENAEINTFGLDNREDTHGFVNKEDNTPGSDNRDGIMFRLDNSEEKTFEFGDA